MLLEKMELKQLFPRRERNGRSPNNIITRWMLILVLSLAKFLIDDKRWVEVRKI